MHKKKSGRESLRTPTRQVLKEMMRRGISLPKRTSSAVSRSTLVETSSKTGELKGMYLAMMSIA